MDLILEPTMLAKRVLTALIAVALLSQPVFGYSKLDQKVDNARLAYRELLQEPDRVVPRRLLDDASCIAVIPNVVKGAFWVGGRSGRGVLTCRNEEGDWSPPIFVKLWGASFGLQIGAAATDLVLFFMTERSAEVLLKSGFTIGGDASIAAGPQGRTAEVATNITVRSEIYSYAKSRGLFAGVALDGARIAPHKKMTTAYYGDQVWPRSVLFDHQVPSLPDEAKALLAELP